MAPSKTCKKCGLSDRYENNGRCRPCQHVRFKIWAAKHRKAKRIKVSQVKPKRPVLDEATKLLVKRQKSRNSYLRKQYGISLDDYNTMIVNQNGACALCSRTEPGGQGSWHVDHDHASGKIRNLLCFSCNVGLGNFKHDPQLLENAALYIREHT